MDDCETYRDNESFDNMKLHDHNMSNRKKNSKWRTLILQQPIWQEGFDRY